VELGASDGQPETDPLSIFSLTVYYSKCIELSGYYCVFSPQRQHLADVFSFRTPLYVPSFHFAVLSEQTAILHNFGAIGSEQAI
jgi:hypothetical protein